MSRGTVLVIEDDAPIRRGLVDALRFHGYSVREAVDGAEGLGSASDVGIDLVLLDLLMPKMDGLTVLAELQKRRPGVPVIILTARGEEQDRVRGLVAGADDYIVKPFSLEELLARVAAVLRRSAERPRAVTSLVIAGLQIDFSRREVRAESGRIGLLTERECGVLAYLASCPGRAVSREELLERVWGVDPRGLQTRTVDMTVARLRELLGDDPHRPRVIITVRGTGYMLAVEGGSE